MCEEKRVKICLIKAACPTLPARPCRSDGPFRRGNAVNSPARPSILSGASLPPTCQEGWQAGGGAMNKFSQRKVRRIYEGGCALWTGEF